MNTIQQIKYAKDMDAFVNTGMFTSPEIQARRAERRRWDAMKAAHARKFTEADWADRERELEEAHQQEESGLMASVAGAFAMTAGLVALAMML